MDFTEQDLIFACAFAVVHRQLNIHDFNYTKDIRMINDVLIQNNKILDSLIEMILKSCVSHQENREDERILCQHYSNIMSDCNSVLSMEVSDRPELESIIQEWSQIQDKFIHHIELCCGFLVRPDTLLLFLSEKEQKIDQISKHLSECLFWICQEDVIRNKDSELSQSLHQSVFVTILVNLSDTILQTMKKVNKHASKVFIDIFNHRFSLQIR